MKLEAIEELYDQYEDMLNKHAWQKTKQFGLEFEDVKREANAIFIHALKSYNANLSGFSTHLTTCLRTRLINAVRRLSDSQGIPIDSIAPIALIQPKPTNFMDKVRELSNEAQELVQLILTGPAELIDHPRTPTAIRRTIKSYLIEQCNWKPYHVRKVYHEIRFLLRKSQPQKSH